MSSASRDARPESFPAAAKPALADRRLRASVRAATGSIRTRRAAVVAELDDWEELRQAGAAIKDAALLSLDEQLVRLETAVVAAGGVVHWARDAAEANDIVVGIALAARASEVVKVKSLATDEIRLGEALERAGVTPIETDLAELVIQLAGERPSHLLVPALHKSRHEIGELFRERLGPPTLPDEPAALAEAARRHLRAAFLRARVAVSGANFAVAETGTVCVVESEGNGRMCTTLPDMLITVMGIEKVVPNWRDLGVLLQLLPRSSTGERMNPYTSLWAGVTEGDGPQAFHLVLLDAGRTAVLADEVGRAALRCIRCSACINVCPVYRQTGGHAYHTPYAGPIGAILAPQLDRGSAAAASLPFASSLCGACYDVCPVKIDIPSILVHERARVVARRPLEAGAGPFRLLARAFSSQERFERAQRLARRAQRLASRDGWLERFPPGPLAVWGRARDLPALPDETFREWWERRGRS